jgi:hypothetical protein
MSWHARWGRPDPFAKPEKPGAVFGIFVVLEMVEPDAHYGYRARVRCARCGHERISVLAQLRHATPIRHRGCTGTTPRRRRR